MDKYLLVCKVLKTIGLKGEMKVYTYSTFSDIRYKKGNKLYYKNNDQYIPLTIATHSFKGGNIDSLSFKEYNDINQISFLIGKELFALKDTKLLSEDEYYYDDLIGLKIISEEEKELGTVDSVEEFPAQITLKISKNLAKGHFFVPFNDFFIKEINLEKGYIKIHLIEGLTD